MADNITRRGTQPPRDSDLKLIAQKIRSMDRDITRLKNNRGPTVPQYDPDNFPAQNVQGQIAIADPSSSQPMTAHAYDSTNGWWQIGGAESGIKFDTYPQEGNYLNLILQGGTTPSTDLTGADSYGGVGIYSDWASTDDNHALVSITAEGSNNAVGFIQGLNVSATFDNTQDLGSYGITVYSQDSSATGLAVGVGSTVFTGDTSEEYLGTAMAFVASTDPGSLFHPATRVSLFADSAILWDQFGLQTSQIPDVDGTGVGGTDRCALYFILDSGVYKLNAVIGTTTTTLATG
jgi:hypothetical protein